MGIHTTHLLHGGAPFPEGRPAAGGAGSIDAKIAEVAHPVLAEARVHPGIDRAKIDRALASVDTAAADRLFSDVKSEGKFDPKRVGHMLLDSSAGMGAAAGIEQLGVTPTWVIENLEEFDPRNPLLTALKDLEKAEKELMSKRGGLGRTPEDVYSKMCGLKPGECVLLSGGFRGHYMLYEWLREPGDPPKFTFRIYTIRA